MLCAMVNIPQPPTGFSIYKKTIGSFVVAVSVPFMMQADREAVAENEEDVPSHITASFDGSWQKREQTSLNGIISATSVDRGKVLNIEVMSKFCFICLINPTSQHECKKNHEGLSGGMEGAGLLNIFNCFLHIQGICYTKYLRGGDSISYQRVVARKPYDPNVSITKLECEGHVRK
jgi:hypothetical protein